MVRKFRWSSAVAGGLLGVGLLASCRFPVPGQGAASLTSLEGSARPAPSLSSPLRSNGAGIRVLLTWPERQIQALDPAASRVVFRVYRAEGLASGADLDDDDAPEAGVDDDDAPVYEKVLDRPAAGGVQVVDLGPIRSIGPHDLSVSVQDAAGKPLSGGGSHLDLLRNQLATASIRLTASDEPHLVDQFPPAALPGQTVTLYGAGLEDDDQDFALGSQEATGEVEVLDGAIARVVVPPEATRSFWQVTDRDEPDEVAVSARPFTTIRNLRWSTTPPSRSFLRARLPLALEALDEAGQIIRPFESRWVPWALEQERCLDCDRYPLEREEGEEEEEEEEGPELGGQPLAALVPGELVLGEREEDLEIHVGTSRVHLDHELEARLVEPADLPAALRQIPSSASVEPVASPAVRRLGQVLFFEKRLSRTGAMSCASCHDPARDWTDGRRTSLDNEGVPLPRHAPSILNTGFHAIQFWDGRSASLAALVGDVFDNPRELHTDFQRFQADVTAQGDLRDRFVAAFGQVPATATEARERSTEALASFVAAQVTGPSAFDRWAAGQGDLSREARLGLGIFIGAGRCNVCHAGPRFTDDRFHNTGIPGNVVRDRGRFDVSGQAVDRGAFKTPGLRNVANTAPYFHDGSARTLGQAIRHYEGVDPLFDHLSSDLVPRSINGVQDAAFLEDFLRSLTGATPSLIP